VHFYNMRDVFRFRVKSGNCPSGTVEKVNCWPEPEVPQPGLTGSDATKSTPRSGRPLARAWLELSLTP
jgi:hypothetical protein